MGRSGLVKQMPAKTGYFHRFSECVLRRVNNNLVFVTLKIKTNQNKHAFHTFEGTLDLGIIMNFCVVSCFRAARSSILCNFLLSPRSNLGPRTL